MASLRAQRTAPWFEAERIGHHSREYGGAIMVRARLLPPKALCFVLLLLVLILAVTQALAATPTAGKAKADRLVMGLILPYRDYMRPWIIGTADHNIQHDPAFEWLFEIDAETGQYKPWLAESWQMAADGRSWRITLQKGVQFHHGYGEFTAKDVVHNHALWYDDYPAHDAGAAGQLAPQSRPPLEKSGGAADRPVQRRQGRRAHV
jgi:ABC-type transport system substrate-binding protein